MPTMHPLATRRSARSHPTLTRAQWAPVDLTLTRSTVETSRPAAGEGRARARRRNIDPSGWGSLGLSRGSVPWAEGRLRRPSGRSRADGNRCL